MWQLIENIPLNIKQ